MKTHYICLSDGDYNRSLTLTHQDEMSNFAEADACATDMIQEEAQYVYVYKLHKVYRDKPSDESRDIEEVYIDADGGNR